MKNFTILLAIIGFFNLASAQTLNKTDYNPGTIGGNIDVSPTGAASYQIPIAVSPGSNGMQPNLSIVYNSESGSGLLGWGWNLAGLSRIYKVNKNPYYDGTTQPAAVETLGALVLDGTRLILSTTPNIYNPENDPYTKVVYSNNTFTVKYQNGLTMEYGKTEGSVIVPKGCTANQAMGWALSKVTDYNGNYIEYKYTGSSQTGEYLIDEIAYTGNAGKAPYAKIKFSYTENDDYSLRFNFSSRDTIDKYNGAPIVAHKNCLLLRILWMGIPQTSTHSSILPMDIQS